MVLVISIPLLLEYMYILYLNGVLFMCSFFILEPRDGCCVCVCFDYVVNVSVALGCVLHYRY